MFFYANKLDKTLSDHHPTNYERYQLYNQYGKKYFEENPALVDLEKFQVTGFRYSAKNDNLELEI